MSLVEPGPADPWGTPQWGIRAGLAGAHRIGQFAPSELARPGLPGAHPPGVSQRGRAQFKLGVQVSGSRPGDKREQVAAEIADLRLAGSLIRGLIGEISGSPRLLGPAQ